MRKPIQNLLKLQELEFADSIDAEAQANIADLRQKIPPHVLQNYDRLADRGKKGVALVRHHVCTGCHMRIPLGVILTLVSGAEFQMCQSCGRYLYMPVDELNELKQASAPEPPPMARRPRHKHTLAPA